jgi:chromosome segregation ATPase
MAAEEVHGRDLSRTVAELEELVGELEGALTAERARTDNAVAHATELSEELEAARQRAQDSLRTLAQVEQLEAELEGALVAHGAALDRVRVLDEANTTTQARVDDLEADLVSSARDRDAMRVQLDGQRDEIESLEAANADLRAAAEAAPRERAAASKQVANDRVRDLERLLDIAEAEHDSLMQEVCDLRNAAAASPAPGAGGPDDGVVAELRTQLSELRAARDAFAVQVRELESAVTISSLHREEESQRAEQLERALSQEQSRVREVEEELRRLRSSTHVDARAGATGRAEPAVPEGEPAPEPEPEQPEPAEAPEASPHVERRSALAELSGLASFGGNEGYRRR